ncbi:MAG: CCA tRNA nucleotidyltransferase [Myxococcota bacterium]
MNAVVVHNLPGLAQPLPMGGALQTLCDQVLAEGGRPLVVGGAVRDHLLGHSPKDLDIEVYGLSLRDLEAALCRIGQVHAVGRAFGVLKVQVHNDDSGSVFDVALPRRESKIGAGHRGFVVESDPGMSFVDAAARRDFTMNAMGYDVQNSVLCDPYGGAADLAVGTLRHVSDAFDEDPLRVLRACQLAARFGLVIAPPTLSRCQHLGGELPSLPKERLWEEFKKLLLKSTMPSIGIWALVDTWDITLFPELQALMGCPQEPEWHPEGDVWVHTLMVVDEAAKLAHAERLDEEETLLCVLGALCHDLGKPTTTALVDGRVRSVDHEAAGEAPTRSFLGRLGAPHLVVEETVAVVKDHLKPFQLWRERDSVGDAALRRLALRVSPRRLARVARADFLGRTTAEALADADEATPWLLSEAERLRVAAMAPRPLLLGRHLLARGIPPGKDMGALLRHAFEAQLEGEFTTVEAGLRWLDLQLAGRTRRSDT